MSKALENQLKSLVESLRYKTGTHQALDLYIHQHAYLISGVYPLDESRLSLIERDDLAPTFAAMSKIIHELGVQKGITDPIGNLLCEFSSLAKDSSYFPTPKELGRLMYALTLGDVTNISEPITLSEPCAGSGAISLEILEEIVNAHPEVDNPLEHVSIFVEELNPLLCKVYFIQLMMKLSHLELILGRRVAPSKVQIKQMDVISRQEGPVSYLLASL
ncbi:hypothetical protein J4N45_10870 [Vibrio sp. SCSIO 43140]|uniref:hypothetical protein n=1 Tax=Vibrio sp. SCSIO 43140 TaxID=2819100 RepID=UPI002076010A|nr:hypothetical protein [Vibrio sp. SCSIO 43140]USD59032.1 hypothetical protein J4N45_10870 [Vibrio sp. SCSIO 43140]